MIEKLVSIYPKSSNYIILNILKIGDIYKIPRRSIELTLLS